MVNQTKLVAASVELGVGPRLGYFLDLASRVSGERVCGAALRRAAREIPGKSPSRAPSRPSRREPLALYARGGRDAALCTPVRVLTGTSVESAKAYFDKVALL